MMSMSKILEVNGHSGEYVDENVVVFIEIVLSILYTEILSSADIDGVLFNLKESLHSIILIETIRVTLMALVSRVYEQSNSEDRIFVYNHHS